MPPDTGDVKYAKKDVVADVEDEFGNKRPVKVAVEGQAVPRGFEDLVKDSDVTTGVPKAVKEDAPAIRRSTTQRRADAAENEREEPSPEEVREQAAAPADVKARRRAKNKARSSGEDK